MSRLVVASQLPELFNNVFAQHVGDAEIIAVPPGLHAPLPAEAKVLVAAPFRKAGGVLPPEPPKGWPYDVQWVQLVSVGIDFYPDWLFDARW